MRTVTLKIHDSIYTQLMGLLEILPKDTIEVLEDSEFPAISLEEAKRKVQNAANNIGQNKGLPLEQAFEQVLKP